jgi:serine protease Do
MPGWTKTATAAVLAFFVGAGAGTGGVWEYLHLTAPSAKSHVSITQYATVANAPSTLPLGPDTIAQVAQRASPAVVQITATIPTSSVSTPLFNLFGNSPFGFGLPFPNQTQYETAIGSGFFFNSQGYILTNDHVINRATRIEVTVPGYKNPFPATVVGADYETDLAVLKINPPKPVPVLPLGNSNATPVGAWVVAIGNPYGLSHTVTEGVISAKGRPLTIGNRHYRNLLQTSAAINPGNSGGPLLNLAGQVIGINTAVATGTQSEPAQGIGFAIPTSTVDQILPQLMAHGRVIRPWLGVFIVTDTPSLAAAYQLPTSHGVVVASVEPGSPAAQAGIQSGDVITAFDGTPVTSASGLQNLVHATHPGQVVSVTLNRNGHVMTVSVTVGTEPNGPITPPQ